MIEIPNHRKKDSSCPQIDDNCFFFLRDCFMNVFLFARKLLE